MLRLRGGRSVEDAGSEAMGFDFKKAFGQKERERSKTEKGAAQEGNGTDVKEALFQLTTQLLGGQKSASKRDFYEILGVEKTATQKEIRDGYYREARKWHPDKNKQDPQAEARFKTISEAYEILGDEEKRKIYDKSGRDGLEAHEAFSNIDIKGVLRALFGGGEFDDVFGDVAELPLVKGVMGNKEEEEEEEDMETKEKRRREEGAKSKSKEDKEAEEEAEAERISKMEEELCKELGGKLRTRLEPRATASVSPIAFDRSCKEWARTLCDAPGGLDLVRMTSQSYRTQAKKYLRRWWGLEAIVTEVKDTFSRMSQGCSLLFGAIKASRMTRDAIAKAKQNSTEAGGEGEGGADGAKRAEKRRKRDVMKDEGDEDEDEDEEMDVDLAEADMLQIAKVGLDVVWRFGVFLLQGRVRLSVKSMMEEERERLRRDKLPDPEVRERMKALAGALLELGHALKTVWEEARAAEPEKAGAPIQLGGE